MRQARELRGLTQPLLAALAGLTEKTVSRHENGYAISARAARVYAEVLEITEAWLRFGAGAGPGEMTGDIVEAYLQSPEGQTATDEVAHMLRTMPYASLGVRRATVQTVRSVRKLIETNLRVGRKLSHARKSGT